MFFKTKSRYIALTLILLLLAVSVILLINKVSDSQKKLNQAADIIESLGKTSFSIDADISDSIDINTSFTIPISIPVHVRMNVSVNAPLSMNVPVMQTLKIPYSVRIDEIMPVDTFFIFPEGITTNINDSIGFNTKIKTRIWPGIRFPVTISGSMPLKQSLYLDPEKLHVSSEIPVHLRLNDSIPVYLDFTVPVKDTLPMNLLIDADATISFYAPLPVKGRLPLKMNTPVEIDFSKTPLKAKFDSLANVMRKIL